jgi:uracil-DNA glycosylase
MSNVYEDIHKIQVSTQLINKEYYEHKPWTNDVIISNLKISREWKKEIFDELFKSNKFKKLQDELIKDIIEGGYLMPYPSLLFSAFNYINFNDVKVVILGQDPYFNAEKVNGIVVPQAMGLSFSVPVGFNIPPSLANIYKNQEKYKNIWRIPEHGNLQFWAYQGCLMLNSALTVRFKEANCHANEWAPITDQIIKQLSDKKEHLIFVLWGRPSERKKHLIDSKKHDILISSHPSGQSCYTKLGEYPAFADFDHFGTINQLLKNKGKAPIIWQL